MAFGFVSTDGALIAEGSVGSVVRFNLSSLLIRQVRAVQIQTAGNVTSPMFSTIVPSETLFGYTESAEAPDVGFSQAGTMVDVFLKTAVYPIEAGTRIGIQFYRNVQAVTATVTKIDVPPKALELRTFLQLDTLYRVLLNKPVPPKVAVKIKEEKRQLGWLN